MEMQSNYSSVYAIHTLIASYGHPTEINQINLYNGRNSFYSEDMQNRQNMSETSTKLMYHA